MDRQAPLRREREKHCRRFISIALKDKCMGNSPWKLPQNCHGDFAEAPKDYPVVNITIDDARQFALGRKALPTSGIARIGDGVSNKRTPLACSANGWKCLGICGRVEY
jgi:hypothetical protein